MRRVVWLLLWLPLVGMAQEFNVRVNVQITQVQGVDRNNINRLQQDIQSYLAARRWTDDPVAPFERINLTLTLVLSGTPTADSYSGTLQVQATRPVYGSTYESLLFNFQDRDIRFTYQPFQPLLYSEASFVSNLVSILNFYAFTVLGLDADSFAPSGGTAYHQRAQAEVLLAQSSSELGWKASDGQRNRYWLNENLLNGSYADVRDISYQYHHFGLDMMHNQPAKARSAILASMDRLQQQFQRNPNLFLVRVWMDTKVGELPRLFTQASPEERQRLLAIVNVLDPSNLPNYQRVLN